MNSNDPDLCRSCGQLRERERRGRLCDACISKRRTKRRFGPDYRAQDKTVASFWRRVDRDGPVIYQGIGRCWLWCGGKSGKGYGQWSRPGNSYRSMLAHRFIWILTRGDIPAGMVVRHRCDNKLCVNPKHLLLGTYSDNVHDCLSRGRFRIGNRYRGEANHRCTTTQRQVEQIKEFRAYGLMYREIAEIVGVSVSVVSLVVCGIRWKHVS